MTNTAFSVLAGGKGTRIGGRKAHTPIAGVPMITHVVNRLGRPLAVVGDTTAAQLVDAHPLSDPDFSSVRGPLLGLYASLEWTNSINAGQVIVVPCDCPLLPEDIVPILQRAIGTRDCACIETARGLEPLIGIWRSTALGRIKTLLGAGLHPPLHQVLSEMHITTIRLTDDRLALNVNTKEDVDRAEQILLNMR